MQPTRPEINEEYLHNLRILDQLTALAVADPKTWYLILGQHEIPSIPGAINKFTVGQAVVIQTHYDKLKESEK